MLPEIRESIRRRGFAFIPEDVPGKQSREAISRFGQLLTLPGLAEVQSLRLQEKESATPNTYSGNYGRGEFPLHTDLAHWSLPPHYFVLRCIVGAENVPTRLVDGTDLIGVVGELRLSRAIVKPRRPIAGQVCLLHLLDANAQVKVLRWDELFIVPATVEGGSASEAVRGYLARGRSTELTLSKPGDTLIVDNWRMLHGRAAASKVVTRRLDRAYIDVLGEA